LGCLAAVSPLAVSEQEAVNATDCTFRAVPDAFLAAQARARQAANERAARLGKSPARWAAGGATPAARDAAIEDLAWVCLNKVDFPFSY
jgi:hypothetical protein